MDSQGNYLDELPRQAVFALDIGTRSIIGMVGIPDGERIEIVAIEQIEHTQRAMIDGQIENIDQVARVAGMVKERLEKKLGCKLARVAVAAAGRSLRTKSVTYELDLGQVQRIDAEMVSRLEAGAISEAETAFFGGDVDEGGQRFYLVGYSVSRYYLDDYILSNLVDHNGRVLKADVIATFLPAEVVESLYAAMRKIGLEIASLTLEPIAAINAAIPPGIRLLNLALVDIGAGTSDIAVCRDGYITGYTMAVQAGDELTESIMKEYLVDFQTAEKIKFATAGDGPIHFNDIMGFEQTITRQQLAAGMKKAVDSLCEEICQKILEANGGVPSAVFLAGGGSLFPGLPEGIVDRLHMDPKRVAIAGRNFGTSAWSNEYELDNPEYATPLGIVISAGLNMIHDSFRIHLNGQPAKLFRNGTFTVMNILMMNGYSYQDMMGKSGQNIVVRFNGQRRVFYGEKAEPCVLRVNGEDAQLSDMVQAGDQLEFTPVHHGADASAALSDLIDPATPGITINGKKARTDGPLKNGDVILVEGMYVPEEIAPESEKVPVVKKTRGRPAKKAAVEKKRTTAVARKKSGTAASGAGRRKKAEQAETSFSESAHQEPEAVTSATEKTAIPETETAASAVEKPGIPETEAVTRAAEKPEAPEREPVEPIAAKTVQAKESEPAPAAAEPVRPEPAVPVPVDSAPAGTEPVRPISADPAQTVAKRQEFRPAFAEPTQPAPKKLMVYLNDRMLILPPKADGQPYYLMDMLEYSELDLEKVAAPVILEINGISGSFQQELKTGDAVKIYEQR